MPISLSKKALCRVICFSLLFTFCAHAFCYANLTFSRSSVMVDVSNASASLCAKGQFLFTLYWRLRGSLAAPLLIGLLSAAFLTASAVLMADLLALSHPASLFSLCGALVLHISVTAINASLLHMADVYFLALLFAAAGAWLCLRHPLGFLPAVLCVCASFGLESSLVSVMPALMLTACLLRALRGEPVRPQLLALTKTLLSLIAGFAAYLAAALLFARRKGVALSAAFWPLADSLPEAFLLPFRQLLAPTTAYAALCAALCVLLMALCLFTMAVLLRKCRTSSRIFAMAALFILPLTISLPVFTETAPDAVSQRLALSMLPVAMAALLDLLPGSLSIKAGRVFRCMASCAFGVTFLSSVVFANQVYLKKNLEYQTTLSAMTRVIEQAEQTDGFVPGYTPVALVGTLENSSIAMAHKGFEHLAVLDAAENNYTASTQEENTWYFWEIMGYPFNFVSDIERDTLAQSEFVMAMPAFPQSGFCAMVDGTLVIKLSPVQSSISKAEGASK